ncbi:hypothetical protein PAMP_009190 [Pampus punctatissimus]
MAVDTIHRTDVQHRVASGLPYREIAVDMAEISVTWSPSSRCKLRTQSPLAQAPSVSTLVETLSVDGSLPHDRLKRTDSRPELSQPVRTSPESASSAHAYCSAHPPWAVPGSSPNSPPLSFCPHGHLSASAHHHQQAIMKGNTTAIFLFVVHFQLFFPGVCRHLCSHAGHHLSHNRLPLNHSLVLLN